MTDANTNLRVRYTYEVRSTRTEVAVYELPTGNRYLRMDNRSFSDRDDCIRCATLIAKFLTNAQMWAG